MSILALTSNTLAGSPGAGQLEYNGQFYATDSNSSRGQVERITQGTAQASTSGTSIDFTGIPAWAKKITVMFNGVSGSGTSPFLIQIGAGTFTTSGYACNVSAGATTSNATAGFLITQFSVAANANQGHVLLTNLNLNNWIESGLIGPNANNSLSVSSGSVSLSGVLDRVRITTVNGTDTFDAGSINIMYEG